MSEFEGYILGLYGLGFVFTFFKLFHAWTRAAETVDEFIMNGLFPSIIVAVFWPACWGYTFHQWNIEE